MKSFSQGYKHVNVFFSPLDYNSQNGPKKNSFEELRDARRALPIFSAKHKIVSEIKKFPSAIVIGETGSGKTTQIPQVRYILGL